MTKKLPKRACRTSCRPPLEQPVEQAFFVSRDSHLDLFATQAERGGLIATFQAHAVELEAWPPGLQR